LRLAFDVVGSGGDAEPAQQGPEVPVVSGEDEGRTRPRPRAPGALDSGEPQVTLDIPDASGRDPPLERTLPRLLRDVNLCGPLTQQPGGDGGDGTGTGCSSTEQEVRPRPYSGQLRVLHSLPSRSCRVQGPDPLSVTVVKPRRLPAIEEHFAGDDLVAARLAGRCRRPIPGRLREQIVAKAAGPGSLVNPCARGLVLSTSGGLGPDVAGAGLDEHGAAVCVSGDG
jgi:hypothetical protein